MSSFSQMQACPININFSTGTLTHWYAYTGNNKDGDGVPSIKQRYDSVTAAPNGTIGAVSIPEYNLPSIPGLQTLNSPATDLFGGFSTIPVINGYAYNYSILLGSTSVSHASSNSQGGYTRGISYEINVPVSSNVQPYTMTYAYAMVLENGSHNSNQQPLFTATLNTPDSTIHCADASYLLPTLNNAGSGSNNATLDQAAAIKEGFSLSGTPSPNSTGNANDNRYRVWTKGWTEVTFDLSPYRGKKVTLTFEADNCIPGGHFAYAYIALKDVCAGLNISGDTVACTNSIITYSIPSLKDATYHWSVPNTWKITSDSTTNIITIKVGSQGGQIMASEINGCANLTDTIQVATKQPSFGGNVTGNNTVCEGINLSNLVLSGNLGSVLRWLSSTDDLTWNSIPATSTNFTATDLTTTTFYRALVQNGKACIPDSSTEAKITVDAKSVGGAISPANSVICEGQNKDAILTLSGNTGSVLNWQTSFDNVLWSNINPIDSNLTYSINGITVPTKYRTVVKNGVCDPDTSTIASVSIFPAKYPQALTYPADTTICFGTTVQLNANVSTGTSYAWYGSGSLYDQGNGSINNAPSLINAQVAPSKTSDYFLTILNADCPIPLKDTFHVIVTSKVIVNAGNDTTIVANQPLQLNAFVNNSTGPYTWLWRPPETGLNNSNVSNPIAILNSSVDSIRYIVRATSTAGCYGEDDIVIRVFKTGPEIFVPSAFTPNGDGRNDILKPIPVGITKLDFFRIYNRWGQLIYSSSIIGNGWDGTLNGTQQPSGAYIYMTKGADYKGNSVFRKGTVVLIR